MTTMKAYAWKVALLLVGAMVVACSEGMMPGMKHMAAAGTGGSGSTGTGASGTGGAGGGACCAPEPVVVQGTACAMNADLGEGISTALYPGLTADEIASRVVSLHVYNPLNKSVLIGGRQLTRAAFSVIAGDGIAMTSCTPPEVVYFSLR